MRILTRFDYSARVKLGIMLLILFALLSNLQLLKQVSAYGLKFMGRDRITLYEKRFDDLKKILPSHGVVGYISDKQIEGTNGDVGALSDYYLAQYALSPVIVIKSPEPSLVVGNFRVNGTTLNISINRNLILVKDFGNGVMLFRNQAK